MARKPPVERPRPSALVRAEHHGAPVHLDDKQRRLLDEALRRGQDLSEEIETKVAAYGRWLLETVFANDSSEALDDRTKNPVWQELVRRAGGPTLSISPAGLYTALRIAARDRRIGDAAWRNLDASRKALLLPLGDDARLRAAARHVSEFKLSHKKTRAYVTELLAEKGVARRVRLTGPLLSQRVRRLRESLDGASVLRKVATLHAEMEPKERAGLVQELEKLQRLLATLTSTIRGK